MGSRSGWKAYLRGGVVLEGAAGMTGVMRVVEVEKYAIVAVSEQSG